MGVKVAAMSGNTIVTRELTVASAEDQSGCDAGTGANSLAVRRRKWWKLALVAASLGTLAATIWSESLSQLVEELVLK